MTVTTAEVLHAARVAALDLDDTEVAQLAEHLASLLHRMAALDELDLAKIEPLERPVPGPGGQPRLRADERRPSLGAEPALANAPDRYDNFFVVPNMLGAAADE